MCFACGGGRPADDRRGVAAQRRRLVRAALLRGARPDRLRAGRLGPPSISAPRAQARRLHRLRAARRAIARGDQGRARQAPLRPCPHTPRLVAAIEQVDRPHRRAARRARAPQGRPHGVHRLRLPLARSRQSANPGDRAARLGAGPRYWIGIPSRHPERTSRYIKRLSTRGEARANGTGHPVCTPLARGRRGPSTPISDTVAAVSDQRPASWRGAGCSQLPLARAMIALLGGLGAALCWSISALCASAASRSIGSASTLAWVMGLGLVLVVLPTALLAPVSQLTPRIVALIALAGATNVVGLRISTWPFGAARWGSSPRSRPPKG